MMAAATEVTGLTKGAFGALEDLVLFEAVEDSEAVAFQLFLFLEGSAEAAVPVFVLLIIKRKHVRTWEMRKNHISTNR